MERANLPLISVIVPIYNIEKYLPICVNSIIEQTYENLEILLIDDGSTDDSGKICDKFCAQDKRCKVIHQKNQGQAEARNKGLQEATGDYISFIDGDDYIHPKFYEILYKAINKGDYSFSMVDAKKTTSVLEGVNKECIETQYTTHILSRDMLMEELFNDNILHGDVTIVVVWNKLYKRTTINGLFFKNIANEDNEFSTQVILKTSSAIVIENAELYYYVQRPSSTEHQSFNQRNINAINCYLLCLNDIPKNQPRYRRLCLERLYKKMLDIRHRSPTDFKSETMCVIKKAVNSTMSEFLQNKNISFVTKTTTLIFYYIPPVFSLYSRLIQNPKFFKLYVRIVHGKQIYTKLKKNYKW